MQTTFINDSFRLLLEKAARFHDRHEAGRQEPFNLFSVLRSEHDEVNLHSRFLTALLDHRKFPGAARENLAAFLNQFGIRQFDHDRATVDREWSNIDILISDQSSLKAIIIENKIWADDQPRQLQRYSQQMREFERHILYLTLDGREASQDSAGEVDYQCISYKDDLVPWLMGCQQRACEEPELRESLAQYLRLIAKITGTDLSGAYMNDLKKLCLEDNNLLLIHDLREAMVEARISLLQELWHEIDEGLQALVPGLPAKSNESEISEARIRRFVTGYRSYGGHGLYYDLDDNARLGVETGDYIFFGIKCKEGASNESYRRLRENLRGWESNADWALYRYPPSDLNLKHTTRKQLALLANEESRQNYVTEIVSGVSTLWREIVKRGLLPRDWRP